MKDLISLKPASMIVFSRYGPMISSADFLNLSCFFPYDWLLQTKAHRVCLLIASFHHQHMLLPEMFLPCAFCHLNQYIVALSSIAFI